MVSVGWAPSRYTVTLEVQPTWLEVPVSVATLLLMVPDSESHDDQRNIWA